MYTFYVRMYVYTSLAWGLWTIRGVEGTCKLWKLVGEPEPPRFKRLVWQGRLRRGPRGRPRHQRYRRGEVSTGGLFKIGGLLGSLLIYHGMLLLHRIV